MPNDFESREGRREILKKYREKLEAMSKGMNKEMRQNKSDFSPTDQEIIKAISGMKTTVQRLLKKHNL